MPLVPRGDKANGVRAQQISESGFRLAGIATGGHDTAVFGHFSF